MVFNLSSFPYFSVFGFHVVDQAGHTSAFQHTLHISLMYRIIL